MVLFCSLIANFILGLTVRLLLEILPFYMHIIYMQLCMGWHYSLQALRHTSCDAMFSILGKSQISCPHPKFRTLGTAPMFKGRFLQSLISNNKDCRILKMRNPKTNRVFPESGCYPGEYLRNANSRDFR